MAKFCGYCGRPLSGMTGRCTVCDGTPPLPPSPPSPPSASCLSMRKIAVIWAVVMLVLCTAIVLIIGLTASEKHDSSHHYIEFAVTDQNGEPCTDYDLHIVGKNQSYERTVSCEEVCKEDGIWLPYGTFAITVTDRQSGRSQTVTRRVFGEYHGDDFGVVFSPKAITKATVATVTEPAAPQELPLADWVGKTFEEFINVYGEDYYTADYWISAALKLISFKLDDGRVINLYYLDESRSLVFNPRTMRIYGISCEVNALTSDMVVEGDVLVGDSMEELCSKRAARWGELFDTMATGYTYIASNGLHVGFYQDDDDEWVCVSERGVYY